MNEDLTVKNVLTMHDVFAQPLSTADYIKLAEARLESCIQMVFGNSFPFIITCAIIDDTDHSLRVEFVIPMCFENKHFVWYFNGDCLLKQAEELSNG